MEVEKNAIWQIIEKVSEEEYKPVAEEFFATEKQAKEELKKQKEKTNKKNLLCFLIDVE
jgi:hypothetical protein